MRKDIISMVNDVKEVIVTNKFSSDVELAKIATTGKITADFEEFKDSLAGVDRRWRWVDGG